MPGSINLFLIATAIGKIQCKSIIFYSFGALLFLFDLLLAFNQCLD